MTSGKYERYKYCRLSGRSSRLRVIQSFLQTGNMAATAREVGISPKRVWEILKDAQIPCPKNKHTSLEQDGQLIEKIRQANDSGSFSSRQDLAKHLGVDPQKVRTLMRDHGIEFNDGILGRRFGLWSPLEKIPRDPMNPKGPVKYLCICKGCDLRKPVQKRTLLDGVSLGCFSCRSRKARPKAVANSKGEIFSSISQAARWAGTTPVAIRKAIALGGDLAGVFWSEREEEISE